MAFYVFSLLFLWANVEAFNVIEYRSPLMIVQNGEGWVINGQPSMVHVIQWGNMNKCLMRRRIFTTRARKPKGKKMFDYLLRKSYDRMRTVRALPGNGLPETPTLRTGVRYLRVNKV